MKNTRVVLPIQQMGELPWRTAALIVWLLVTLAHANTPPVLTHPIADQTNTYGGAFSYAIASDTFSDPDAGQTLSYAASGLPPGISFDTSSLTLLGTNTSVGSFMVTITATDDGSPPMSTNANFTFGIGKASLTIHPFDATRSYGFFNPYLPLNYDGLMLNDQFFDLDFSAFAYSDAAPMSPPATYPIHVSTSDSPPVDHRYVVTVQEGTLTVTNAPLLVAAADLCRPYGQTNPPLIGVISGVQYFDNITATFSTPATPSSPPGSYPINAILNDPDHRLGNYALTLVDAFLSVDAVDPHPQFTVLHSFGVSNLAEFNITGDLLEASDGRLYGTDGHGVFRIQKDGSNFTRLRFLDAYGSLIEDASHSLYGYSGFSTSPAGYIWKMNLDGSGYTVLHDFAVSPTDGSGPVDRLFEGSDGRLYGTTTLGGGSSKGTVFGIAKDGSNYAVLHEFANSTEGYNPVAGLAEGTNGMLYGFTSFGGAANSVYGGVVFKLNKNGTGFQGVHDFTLTANDGNTPSGRLLLASDGAFYGTTTYGGGPGDGGTVFRLTDGPGSYQILKSFPSSGSDGMGPSGALCQGTNGTLYGTTYSGGTNGWGTLFSITKDGLAYTVMRQLTDPINPFSGLVPGTDGRVYGTARIDFFTCDLNGSNYHVFHRTSFSGGDGAGPLGDPVEARDGTLYGTTTDGGSQRAGTVFTINRDGTGYQILYSFSGLPGESGYPIGELVDGLDGGLYGITLLGGQGSGTIFRINKDGSGIALLHSFGSGLANDGVPNARGGGLFQAKDGFLYGSTYSGGLSNLGIIFKIDTNGAAYSVIHNFAGTDGNYPSGTLIEDVDGFLYGTTSGDFSLPGSIFRLKPDGTQFTVLHTFDPFSGKEYWPKAGLLLAGDGSLYGTASLGGPLIMGEVFRMNRDGTGFQMVHRFLANTTDAAQPDSRLIEGRDGLLYGHASYGGDDLYYGAIFRLKMDGSDYGVLHSFHFNDDLHGFTAGRDGNLYGFIYGLSSPVPNFGTLFRLSISYNNPPLLNTAIPDQTGSYGSPFNFSLPPGTFSEPDFGQTLTYSATGLPPGISVDNTSGALNGTPGSAGTNVVTIAATDSGSPPSGTNATFALVVAKAPLLVTADSTNRPYGVPNPTFTGALIGLVNNDSIGATFNTTATQSSPPGDYIIIPSLIDPDGRRVNYSIVTNEGTLSIQGVTLTSSGSGPNKMFCWPTNAAAFLLEYADDLTPPVNWQPVTTGLTTNNTTICFTPPSGPSAPASFYRLRLP